MNKNIMDKLIEWRNSKVRKPLILRGSNQLLKSNIIEQFWKKNYNEIAYFHCKNNIELYNLFNNEKSPQKILEQLSIIFGKPLIPETTLVVFDDIQECPKVLASLKYFNEKANEYHIICTGSSIGILLANRSFAVGNVDLLDIERI